jgi:murein DD-endopeptidase MepM/ murein hydrolase activator NlpD
MRSVAEPQCSLRWLRLALLATISVGAAGCSGDTQRFGDAPQQTKTDVTGSVPQHHPGVQSAPLPPPTAAQPATNPAPGSTSSPRVAANAAARPAPVLSAPQTTAGDHVHVIAPGETLIKLSRQYHKPLVEIAKANHIAPYTMVKVGDRIVIPGARMQHAAGAKPATVAETSKPAPVQKVAAASTTSTVNVVTPAAQELVPDKAKAEVTSAMPSFRWPVRGRVITAFGPKPTGSQNDGINVAVPEGTPIKAAEDGVVAYAGNELKSYGNLVLVRHSSGYVTAYAHASEILVKRDDHVKRGQIIAKAGQTGQVAAPQLHFEIRKGSTPIDPMPFLDKGSNG